MRHLELINVALALKFPQPGFPSCFADHGYALPMLGTPFLLPDGRKVVPDLVMTHRDRGITFIIEVKSGKNADLDQLARMLSVTPQDLREKAFIEISDTSTHVVHILYLCETIHLPTISRTIESERVSIIGFNGCQFEIVGAPLPDPQLQAALHTATVAPDAIHLAILPFDEESPPADICRAIAPNIVEAMMAGYDKVTPDGLMRSTHGGLCDMMASLGAGSASSLVVKKIKGVLDELVVGELADWFERVPKQAVWRFRSGLPTDGTRTRELQRLRTALDRYIERVGGSNGVQQPLFPDLDEPESFAALDPLGGDLD